MADPEETAAETVEDIGDAGGEAAVADAGETSGEAEIQAPLTVNTASGGDSQELVNTAEAGTGTADRVGGDDGGDEGQEGLQSIIDPTEEGGAGGEEQSAEADANAATQTSARQEADHSALAGELAGDAEVDKMEVSEEHDQSNSPEKSPEQSPEDTVGGDTVGEDTVGGDTVGADATNDQSEQVDASNMDASTTAGFSVPEDGDAATANATAAGVKQPLSSRMEGADSPRPTTPPTTAAGHAPSSPGPAPDGTGLPVAELATQRSTRSSRDNSSRGAHKGADSPVVYIPTDGEAGGAGGGAGGSGGGAGVDSKQEPGQTPAQQQPPVHIANAGELSSIKGTLDRGADYYKNATATVKFVLTTTGQVATQRCRLLDSIGDLKQQFAEELKISKDIILLLYDGKSMPDKITLQALGVCPNQMIQLEMKSADEELSPIKQFKPRQPYHMPDVITVRIMSDLPPAATAVPPPTYEDVVVEIERCTFTKPYLGGYRHKVNGVEFHHASAQTMRRPKPDTGKVLYTRDSQTTEEKHLYQQTTNDISTQMTKIGCYIATGTDYMLSPGKYTTADERSKYVLKQVVMVQKYYRRWLARRYVAKVRDDTAKRLEWERLQELKKIAAKEARVKKEFERRMNPKTKEDFNLLYHALEKWRIEEVDHIDDTLEGAERKAALCQLLDQQTELIASIGRHKLNSQEANRLANIQKFLDKAAAPKKWRSYDGRTMELKTPYSLRAEQLKEIYNSINMQFLTQDERLDALLTLKHTVKEHDCKLTKDIVDLIDREADLLMRGTKDSNLVGLRNRISTLFLQYLKTPTFNPQIAKLLKVPQDPSTLRKNIHYCTSCERYLQSEDFTLSLNSRATGNCRKCTEADNAARTRLEFGHYKQMLRSLREEEKRSDAGAEIVFLVQEKDLRYLVERIWNGQSILSAYEDIYDLCLARWDRFSEWSPWNCILLTKEESRAHNQLNALTESYGRVFIHKVEHRHTLAKSYFSRLPGMSAVLERACNIKRYWNEIEKINTFRKDLR